MPYEATFQLHVTGHGDVLAEERLLRSLRDALKEIDDADIQFSSPSTAVPNSKTGVALGTPALIVLLSLATSGTVRVLLELIRAWCEKDKHRRVQLTMDDLTIEIPASPTEVQERIINRVVERRGS